MTEVIRTGTAGTGQPAADKTLTVTITLKPRGRFSEDFADGLATRAREILRGLEHCLDPGRAKVEIEYSYPQWKRLYPAQAEAGERP
jgi:hypothetical protein